MKSKFILKLLLLVAFSILVYSCMHDDLNSSAENSPSKEYNSKSLWKEDETYIKNVMKIYQENESEIKKVNGTPLWDYAMTMGRTNESFLIVPIANGKTIVSCLKVPRNGNYITFINDIDPEHIKFFEGYATLEKRKPLKQDKMSSEAARGIVQCAVSSVSMWYPNSETNPDAGGHWETQYITVCNEIGGGDTPTNPNPEGPTFPYYPGGGGGTNSSGNPCQKLKEKTTSTNFQSNITTLEGKTGDNYESGFRISSDGQSQILQNKPGTREVDMKIFTNTVLLMHSHYDKLFPMFSPGDIVFFNKWIIWAQNWNSVSTNTPKIPLNDLTFVLVTSNGNYSINFDGTNTTSLPNYTQEEFDNLNEKYIEQLSSAVSVGNVSGNINYDTEKLEKEFLKFLAKRMDMPGLKLYQTKSNGNKEIKLVNGNRSEVPCP
ncbi:hypothetical protein PFY10_20060 [Chryseobacterium daecheongense]|nr:hypothetical protein PFY10_20060 [Chryseobacterium daecheongense]